jgi:hypothetical protein
LRVDGQLQAGEELTAGEGAQLIGRAGDAMVIQRGADPLGLAGALTQHVSRRQRGGGYVVSPASLHDR